VGKTVIAGNFDALEERRVPVRSSGKPVRREPDAMRPALAEATVLLPRLAMIAERWRLWERARTGPASTRGASGAPIVHCTDEIA
jgi:hypothetical protein